MADLTYTNKATERRPSPNITPGPGDAHSVKVAASCVIELAASASGSTVFLGRIPSNMRLLPNCLIFSDDLATSGSPTLDIGLASVDSNITSDPDAINNGLSLSAATTTTTLFDAASMTDAGKPAWAHVAGVTADPGGQLDIYGSVKDAATTQTGTLSVTIYGYID